uniref:Chromo domain-containing protein n=1 Tax=Elaeophora elaphi TaxID=1147741 RepID=A0A158Q889_9BILA
MVLMKIVDSLDDETDDMRLDLEMSESSSSVTDDESSLPDGVFIVQEIVDHKCYGELRRKKLIDRRNISHNSLFFRVHWKGFPGQDTWEPLKSIQHVDALKEYAREHNLTHLIPPGNDSNETDHIDTDDERSKEKGKEGRNSDTDNEKCPRKKSKILIDSETAEEDDEIVNVRGNKRNCQRHYYNDLVKCPRRIDCKKTWWFRCNEKKKYDYPKLFSRERKRDISCTLSYQNGKKTSKGDDHVARKPIRKYIEMTTDGFTATNNRTRSVSPIIDRVLRKQQSYDMINDEEFRDDQNFLKGTKISSAIAQSELAFVAKKLEEGCVLRMFWMKIHHYNLHSPLRQIRKAKAYELDCILFKIINESKTFERHCFLLRKCLIKQNALEFLKQLRIMERWCASASENFDAIIFGVFTANENISKFVQMLSDNCFAPKHHRCGIFDISLSCLSLKYRAKLFERLNHETKHRLLDIVIGMGCTSGRFCLLDVLIKYGINIGCAKTHPIQQCVLNGNEEAVLHLILNGFEVKRIKELPNNDLHVQACKIVDSINAYLDRLNLNIQCCTMALLKEHSTKFTYDDTDTFPISNICLHRIGQIDRNVCLIVSSSKSSSTTTFSSKKSHVLVMHSLSLSAAESIMNIDIHQRHLPVQFHKHLQFHFGNQSDEMDLICVLHDDNSCIYWFPHGYNNKIGTRVHVKLSYTPNDYINETNNLVVLQLWDIQISPALLLALIKKTDIKE